MNTLDYQKNKKGKTKPTKPQNTPALSLTLSSYTILA